LNFSKELIPARALDDYNDFKKNRFPKNRGEIMIFIGVDGFDVYNTSVPFSYKGKTVIAGRVERRDLESAATMFFEKTPNGWALMPEARVISGLQDPFITTIKGSLILGGVDAVWRDDGSLVTFHTDFFNIDDLSCPRHIIHGPTHMKDIRLLELPDGRVAVFSRPNGSAVSEHGIVAAVGFTVVNDLRELTAETIARAELIRWLFLSDEWGGCNQLHNLKNGLIGIIGHKSWGGGEMEGGRELHYYSFAAAINPVTREISPVSVIGSRDCFPDLDAKRPNLKDVCFTSGIVRNGDGTAVLYSGLSDCREGCILIDDPFVRYENLTK